MRVVHACPVPLDLATIESSFTRNNMSRAMPLQYLELLTALMMVFDGINLFFPSFFLLVLHNVRKHMPAHLLTDESHLLDLIECLQKC